MDTFNEDYYEVQQLNKYFDRWCALANPENEYKSKFSEQEAVDLYDEMKELGYEVRLVHLQKNVVCLSRGVTCQK